MKTGRQSSELRLCNVFFSRNIVDLGVIAVVIGVIAVVHGVITVVIGVIAIVIGVIAVVMVLSL